MNLTELSDRLEALTKHLQRQGGQSLVPGIKPWRHIKIKDMVEAVEAARKQITKEAEKTRTVRQWADFELVEEHCRAYLLYKPSDPTWFRFIKAKNDDDALAEVRKIVREEEYNNQADTGHHNQG